MYQRAGKCETNMKIDYPVDSACGFVTGLQSLNENGAPGGGGVGATTAFTVLFGMTTVAMGAYSYFLYQSKSPYPFD